MRPPASRGCARRRCSSIRRWTAFSRRCRSPPPWRSRDRCRRRAVSGAGYGDAGLGYDDDSDRWCHDRRAAQARSAARDPQDRRGRAELPGEIPRRSGAGRIDHRAGPGHGAQRPLHRAPRAPAARPVTSWAFTRGVTIFAVGFLLLNAVLLAMIDHFFWAGVCVAVAGLAVVGWVRYRRILAELAAARKEMKREVQELRDLLHTHRRT